MPDNIPFTFTLKLSLYHKNTKGTYKMETTLLEAATSQGIWVLLFISLFLYTIKHHEKMEEKQESREKEYLNLINVLTEKFSILSEIQENIEEIKNKLEK
ncbi:hypothetical protein B5F29_05085 [Lachnoclostridium sp. An196]|nr:hypothetical protein B5F29_05085 [Lachnoclostridium sp. An196]